MLIGFVGSPSAARADVVLTGSDWPVWETARAMDQLGLSKNVKYEFRKYADSIALFEAKRADAVLINLYDYLVLCRDANIAQNTSILLVTDFSQGGDVVVSRSSIGSPGDLKGQAVGLQADSLSLYLLHLTLAKAGLSIKDVTVVRTKGEVLGQAFEKNTKLAAVVGWNPYAAAAIGAGGKALATSAAFPGQIVDVLVVWNDSLANNRAVFEGYVRDWFAARENAQVLEKAAALNNVDAQEFTLWLGDAKTFDTAADAAAAFDACAKAIEGIDSFLANHKADVPKEVQAFFTARAVDRNLIDDSIVRGIASGQQAAVGQ
jgi:ABC-type nitrate/sulfonate/bicarbonate transport system substrate-binding protein